MSQYYICHIKNGCRLQKEQRRAVINHLSKQDNVILQAKWWHNQIIVECIDRPNTGLINVKLIGRITKIFDATPHLEKVTSISLMGDGIGKLIMPPSSTNRNDVSSPINSSIPVGPFSAPVVPHLPLLAAPVVFKKQKKQPAEPKPKDPMDDFIGLETILAQFRAAARSFTINRFSNAHLGTQIEDGFFNVLLVGPKGVGKTSLAKAFAEVLRQEGTISAEGKIIFKSAPHLIDKFIGHTEKTVIKVMQDAKDGVLIIDEIDGWLNGSDFGEAAISTLNVEMGNNRNAPIVIATCYGSRYEDLTRANEGLARRFANTFHLESYSTDVLMDIFMRKLTMAKLVKPDLAIQHAVRDVLTQAHRKKGVQFGNAGEVENIIQKMNEARGERLKPEFDKAREMTEAGTTLLREQKKALLSFDISDVPEYDASLRAYVRRQQEPTRQPTAQKLKVVSLHPANGNP